VIQPTALIPFIPGGKDFAASRSLFQSLGAQEQWTADGLVGFQWGAVRFLLQDFNDAHFAENLMMTIEVANLDEWWESVNALKLPERYAGFRIKPPTDFPWGREIHFIDLAGVCWHVRQSR
jgi:hypothetical protein